MFTQLSKLEPEMSVLHGSLLNSKAKLDLTLYSYKNKQICEEKSINLDPTFETYNNLPSRSENSTVSTQKLLNDLQVKQDNHLLSLSNQLYELESIGNTLGEELEKQSNILDSISE